MLRLSMSFVVILGLSSTGFAQGAPDYFGKYESRNFPDGHGISSKESRNGLPEKNRIERRKAFPFGQRVERIPEGYGLSLGRIKPMIDVENDRLHYGRSR